MTAAGAFWGALLGMIVMLVYEAMQLTGITAWPTHTVIIGTAVTLPLIVIISLVTSQQASQQDSQSAVRHLNEDHEPILDLLHQGYTQMVELTDFLEIDAAHANRLVDELVGAGLVQRQAVSGPDFFTLGLTPQGEQRMEGHGKSGESAPPPSSLHAIGLQVLKQIEASPQALRTLGTAVDASASTLGVVISRLERLGQVRSYGIWERRFSLSDKGREALQAAVRI
jgi:DNA-binding MarR family transcriptional regulator